VATDETASSPDTELVEVIDDTGKVVDITTRAEMRRQNLPHRCTYIAVVDHNNQLVVHRRADWKDVNPGYWDIAFGGVCGVGESWLESAKRELAEEAGITETNLIDIDQIWYVDQTTVTLGQIYLARWDGPIHPNDGEVVAVDKVRLSEIRSWVGSHQVCADSAAALDTILAHIG